MNGYGFVDTAEAMTPGKLYDRSLAAMRQVGLTAPLQAVVKVKVEKIYNLGIPGAGEQIG